MTTPPRRVHSSDGTVIVESFGDEARLLLGNIEVMVRGIERVLTVAKGKDAQMVVRSGREVVGGLLGQDGRSIISLRTDRESGITTIVRNTPGTSAQQWSIVIAGTDDPRGEW